MFLRKMQGGRIFLLLLAQNKKNALRLSLQSVFKTNQNQL